MIRIGLIVNPVAGMGGSVGLKGTDGKVQEAVLRGAAPNAGNRARETIALLARDPGMVFFTCSGAMGENTLRESGAGQFSVEYRHTGESSGEDTKAAARKFRALGVDLILFCGGDGTARDIFDAVDRTVPILGIPAGVKMYSGVFALDPTRAAEVAREAGTLSLQDTEILDIDEEAYRAGAFVTRLYGIARTPVLRDLVQLPKEIHAEQDDDLAKDGIARFIGELLVPGTTYILGAGTTTERIARHIGLGKTLLGVDVIRDRKCIAPDADERTLLRIIAESQESRIIVSPLGTQGFILGRGSQQISANVLRNCGPGSLIVVGTPQKLAETPVLHVDSGDRELDAALGDSLSVVCGYRLAQRKRLAR
ncbi:MAG: ATP-NAD kinase family protein [Methanoregulaceae archaeon]